MTNSLPGSEILAAQHIVKTTIAILSILDSAPSLLGQGRALPWSSSSLLHKNLARLSPTPPVTWWLCPHTPGIFGAMRYIEGGRARWRLLVQSRKPKTFAAATGSVVTGKSQRCKNCVRGNQIPIGRRAKGPSTYNSVIAWQAAFQQSPPPFHQSCLTEPRLADLLNCRLIVRQAHVRPGVRRL